MLTAGRGNGVLFLLQEDGRSLESVRFVTPGRQGRPPLLFIHGVEFATPEESLRDLVWPMIEALGKGRTAERAVYVFVWNSLLTNHTAINRILDCSLSRRIVLALTQLPKCRIYLRDVERRAREAAQDLLPFAAEWNGESRTGPTVITHSMGSLVWAETLKLLYEGSKNLPRPGIWWSLQPAMHRRAFAEGGEYSIIPKIYTGLESAKALVWYSRLDYILSSIYLLSKGGFALGQYGCPSGKIPQRDVTPWVKEAHGMQHLSSRWGHFFERVKPILSEQADALGI